MINAKLSLHLSDDGSGPEFEKSSKNGRSIVSVEAALVVILFEPTSLLLTESPITTSCANREVEKKADVIIYMSTLFKSVYSWSIGSASSKRSESDIKISVESTGSFVESVVSHI